MGIAIIGILTLAWWLGMKERKRLGVAKLPDSGAWNGYAMHDDEDALPTMEGDAEDIKRPKLLWVNFALTIALMAGLVVGILPMPILFMIGFALALLINYPNLAEQRRRVVNHAGNVLSSGLVDLCWHLHRHLVKHWNGRRDVTQLSGTHPRQLWALLGGDYCYRQHALHFFMSNDAFYFGVLPILSEAASHYGITPVEMARASLAGQPVHLLSPLVPSTYLLVGLAKVDFGDHQRFSLKWAVLISMVLLLSSLLFLIYPLAA